MMDKDYENSINFFMNDQFIDRLYYEALNAGEMQLFYVFYKRFKNKAIWWRDTYIETMEEWWKNVSRNIHSTTSKSDFYYENKNNYSDKKNLKIFKRVKNSGTKSGYFNDYDKKHLDEFAKIRKQMDETFTQFEFYIDSELALQSYDFQTYFELTLEFLGSTTGDKTVLPIIGKSVLPLFKKFDLYSGLFFRLITLLCYFESEDLESLMFPLHSIDILKSYGIFKIDPSTVTISEDHKTRIHDLFTAMLKDYKICEL